MKAAAFRRMFFSGNWIRNYNVLRSTRNSLQRYGENIAFKISRKISRSYRQLQDINYINYGAYGSPIKMKHKLPV